jgi:hypothetical protein
MKKLLSVLGINIVLFVSACTGGSSDGTTDNNTNNKVQQAKIVSMKVMNNQAVPAEAIKEMRVYAETDSGVTLDVSEEVQLSTSDSTVASVLAGNLIEAKKVGATQLKMSLYGQTYTETITVAANEVSRVEITTDDPLEMRVGHPQILTANLYDVNGDLLEGVKPAWTSSKTGIVKVDRNTGLATPIVIGDAVVITATSNGKSDTISVNVTTAVLNSISLTEKDHKTTLAVGTSGKVIVTGEYVDTNHKYFDEDVSSLVAWSNSDPEQLSVSTTGIIKAEQHGNVAVSIGVSIGTVVADPIFINTTAATIDSIVIVPGTELTLAKGQTQYLHVYAKDSNREYHDITQEVGLTITPANSGIVQVMGGKDKGLIRGMQADANTEVNILYETPDKRNIITSIKVHVSNAKMTGISLSPENLTLIKGQTQHLTVMNNYSDGTSSEISPADIKSIVWENSEPSTVSLNQQTLIVKGLSEGKSSNLRAAIKETKSNQSTITVSPAKIMGLRISPTNDMSLKEERTFAAEALLSDGSSIKNFNTNISWSSSETDIISIDPKTGVATTHEREGIARIRVTYKGDSGKDIIGFADITAKKNFTASLVLKSISPFEGETNVSRRPDIHFEFNKKALHVKHANVKLLNKNGGEIEIGDIVEDGTAYTFSPKKDLDKTEIYSIVLGSGITDLADNPFQTTTVHFTTGTTTILSASLESPKDLDNASLSPNIRLHFNKPVDNVNTQTVKLHKGSINGPAVNIAIKANNDIEYYARYTFTPVHNLDKSTKYYVVLSNAIRDEEGNHLNQKDEVSFTTGNFVAPEAEITPVNNAENIVKHPVIKVHFSKEVINVNNDTISLHKDSVSGKDIEITPVNLDGTNDYTFSPVDDLETLTEYHIVLSKGIIDKEGNRLHEVSSKFTTGDLSELKVVSTFPSDKEENISALPTIQIRLSKDVINVDDTTVKLYRDSVNGTEVSTINITKSPGHVLTFSPKANLEAFTEYYIVVKGLKDHIGNELNHSIHFKTANNDSVSLIAPQSTTDVSRLTEIKIQFANAVKNLDMSNVKLYSNNNQVEIKNIVNHGDNVYQVYVKDDLLRNSHYKLIVSDIISDNGFTVKSSEFDFTTNNKAIAELHNTTAGSTYVLRYSVDSRGAHSDLNGGEVMLVEFNSYVYTAVKIDGRVNSDSCTYKEITSGQNERYWIRHEGAYQGDVSAVKYDHSQLERECELL